jgi:ATP-dependent RNA circularization protein (DNA/RNA ligase family)
MSAKEYQIEEKLRAFAAKTGCDVAIQGELIGLGIQGNKYGLTKKELRFFNVIDLVSGKLFDHAEQLKILSGWGWEGVPVLGTLVLNHSVSELVKFSEGMSVLKSSTHREGIVLRPAQERYDRLIGGRLSFKVINPKFLLKYDE